MKLFVLVNNGEDGSFYPIFSLDKALIDRLEKDYFRNLRKIREFDWFNPGIFRCETVEVPDGSTSQSLGVELLEDELAIDSN